MFDRLVESTGERRNARTFAFFLGTGSVWTVALVAVITIGIVTFDAKVNADFDQLRLAPVTPPTPPPPPAPSQPNPVRTTQQPRFVSQPKPPVELVPLRPTPPVGPVSSTVPGIIGGAVDGDPEGVLSVAPGDPNAPGVSTASAPVQPPAPPVVEPAPPAPPRPQVIRSSVPITGIAIDRVQPAYPEMAKSIAIEGAVVVEVTVSETGRVIQAKSISGHPLLRDAALSAAKRWTFTPTLLNNVPVKVVGTITFNFKRS